jgi:hypothetical protein
MLLDAWTHPCSGAGFPPGRSLAGNDRRVWGPAAPSVKGSAPYARGLLDWSSSRDPGRGLLSFRRSTSSSSSHCRMDDAGPSQGFPRSGDAPGCRPCEYRKQGFPRGLLARRSARLVVTMGMPALITDGISEHMGSAGSNGVSWIRPHRARLRNPAGDGRCSERCEAAGFARSDERLRQAPH